MEAAMYEEEERKLHRQQMELQLQQHLQAMQQLPGQVEGGHGGDALVGERVVAADGVEDAGALAGDAGGAGMPRPNQLTLSFQGQVYVFDDVPADKVQAVLLLLGGHELPLEVAGMIEPVRQNHMVSDDIPQSLSSHHRQASLMRFKEKRKERCFDKRIRYHVRKEVAQRMQRKKGQFISSKVSPEDAASASSCSNLGQGTCEGEAQQQTFCQHCGCSQSCTPMMRRGPGGPKSLCNACGLMWANKGTLRDLSKTSTTKTQSSSANTNNQGDGINPCMGSNSLMAVVTSNGHDSVMTTN